MARGRKNQADTSTSPKKLTPDEEKANVRKTVGGILTECQKSVKTHLMLLEKFKNFYYSVTDSHENARQHQRYCIHMSWRYMYGIFSHGKGVCLENALKFYKTLIGTVGLQVDLESAEFPFKDLPPFFFNILKCLFQTHSDGRASVRLHVVELARVIAENFRDHPAYTHNRRHSNLNIPTELMELVEHRVRDKQHTVRVEVIHFLGLYSEDDRARKLVAKAAKTDPNPEVRRTSLKFLMNIPSIKTTLIIPFAYDPNDGVRLEAFKGLVNIPLKKISEVSQRRKLLCWGLTNGSSKVKSIVEKELLPNWIEQSNKSVPQLLTRLHLAAKPHIINLIVDSLYVHGDEETLEKVNLEFLSDKRVIPIEKLTVETANYWLILCSKFKDVPKSSEKLIPEPLDLCSYILDIMKVVDGKNTKDREPDQDPEYSLILCLTLVLRITEFISFEEGSRREMEAVVKKVLLEPALDDAVVVNSAMDLAFQIIPKFQFESFMSSIFRIVFEEAYPVLNGSKSRADVTVQENTLVRADTEIPMDEDTPAVVQNCLEENENVDENGTNNGASTPVNTTGANKRTQNLGPICVSTPFLDPAAARATYELENLKKELGTKKLRKLRLHYALERARNTKNYSNLQQITTRCKEADREVREIYARVKAASHAKNIGFITEQGLAAPLESPIVGPSRNAPPSPGSPMMFSDDIVLDEENNGRILKGLSILIRYVKLYRHVNPTIQMLFDFSIIPCLEDEDPRIRAKIMHLMCMISLVDESQAKSIMILMYKGVCLEEDKTVKSAAFKSMLDLIVEYEPSTFKASPQKEENYDQFPLPKALSDPLATDEEIEEEFLNTVMNYGSGSTDVDVVTFRVDGLIKLLLRDRIKKADVIADLFHLRFNPVYESTAIFCHISWWLPLYLCYGKPHLELVGEALLISLRRVFEGDEIDRAEQEQIYGKIIDFVFSHITSEIVQQKYKDLNIVHEKVALAVLHEINHDITRKTNILLAKCLKDLTIETPDSIRAIQEVCDAIDESIAGLGVPTGSSGLHSQLTLFTKKISKNLKPIPLD